MYSAEKKGEAGMKNPSSDDLRSLMQEIYAFDEEAPSKEERVRRLEGIFTKLLDSGRLFELLERADDPQNPEEATEILKALDYLITGLKNEGLDESDLERLVGFGHEQLVNRLRIMKEIRRKQY